MKDSSQLLKFMYLLPKTSIPGSNCRCLVLILFLNCGLRGEFTMTWLQRIDWFCLDPPWLWCSVSLVLRRHGTWGHRSVGIVLECYIDWRKWTILAKLPLWSWGISRFAPKESSSIFQYTCSLDNQRPRYQKCYMTQQQKHL